MRYAFGVAVLFLMLLDGVCVVSLTAENISFRGKALLAFATVALNVLVFAVFGEDKK